MNTRSNRLVVERRWPWLAAALDDAPEPRDAALLSDLPAQPIRLDGVQLAGGHEPEREARLQAALVPEDATSATVYGLGEGWLARELLARPGIESLRICPLSTMALAVVLEHLPLETLLSDERVEFVDPRAERELSTPFSVSPAELVLADGAGARVRDLVQLELATPFLRQRRNALSAEIQSRIAGNARHLAEDGDVAALDGTWNGARVHVAAGGPSLASSYDLLRARPAGEPLLACDAALRSLVTAGIVPDVVLSMDLDREALIGLLDVEPEVAQRATLVYDPCAHADAVGTWRGRRLVTYAQHDAYDDIARRLPRARLWSAGSVLHSAVDLARRGGAAEVVLHGADFATPGGKSHVDGFAWQKALPDRGPHGAWVEGRDGTRLRTLPNLVGYLRELERFIARHPELRFVNHSSGAVIAGAQSAEVAA